MIQYMPEENICRLSGELIFCTAVQCLEQFDGVKEKIHTTVILDCSGVSKADSSFLAVLIEIRCWAHKKRLPFSLKKLPMFLKNFLSVYGIEELLTTAIIDGSLSSAEFTLKR